MKKKDDCHTYQGAKRLAKSIVDYWRSRGYAGVVAETFRVYPNDSHSPWGVRSNLLGGLPQR